MQETRLTNGELDRVSGTRLATLWLLLPYSVVSCFVAAVSADEEPGLALIWGVVGLLAFATLAWAWFERQQARLFLRELSRTSLAVAAGTTTSGVTLRQYVVAVGLLAVEAEFRTRPDPRRRSALPILITLFLGWWSFPWGPFRTIMVVMTDLRGGIETTPRDLLSALRQPPRVLPAWWKRTLALDSKSVPEIALNISILVVLGVLAFAVLAAVVVSRISPARR